MSNILVAFILGGPEDGQDVKVLRGDVRHERNGIPYRLEVRKVYDHHLDREISRVYAVHPELEAR